MEVGGERGGKERVEERDGEATSDRFLFGAPKDKHEEKGRWSLRLGWF